MKTNFLGSAYQSKSLPLSAQTCINLFTEQNESQNGGIGAFFGTAGLVKKLTLAGGAIRGLHASVDDDWLYVACGANLYRVDGTWTPTLLATLSSSDGPVVFCQNTNQVACAHGGGWAVVNSSTGVVTVPVDAETTIDLSFIDNYGVFARSDGTYGWTGLADFTSLSALNFASAEGNPDRTIRTIVDHRELWLMGTDTIEVATVSSDPELPFVRTAFIEQGILAPLSAVKQDNSVFWLGRNEFGQGCVYRAQGYTPERISTFPVEQWIEKTAAPQYARAYTYQQGGHHFYVINFNEGTWAYDINTGEWSQRAYRDPSRGTLQRHRADCHAMFKGIHIVGDYENGNLYQLDPNAGTDDGALIYRERAWPQADAENNLQVFSRGELIADTGIGLDGAVSPDDANPSVWLSLSKDGGRSWSNERQAQLGAIGQYGARAQWFALGSGRQVYFKLRTTTAAPVRWRGFNLDGGPAAR